MEQLSFNQNLAYQAGMGAPVFPAHSAHATASAETGNIRRRAVLRTESARVEEAAGNVTEIILPAGQVENFQLLLPMLTQLNQEKRWLAWIDPPAALVSKWQKMHGIVAGELLILRSTAEHPATELAERALRAGTCHAVVLWTDRPGRATLKALQAASAEGRSHGVVLRQR